MESVRRRGGTLKPIRPKKEGEEESAAAAEEGGEPLSPASVMFHEQRFNVYIIVVFGCHTPISVDVLKAKLTETLVNHPRFCSLQVADENNGGKLRWVRTKVDIEEHVRVPELDASMDSPEKFIEDYASGLSTTTIHPTKPLWDIHLLNLRTAEAAAVCVLRMHHSLGDGTSLISLLLASTRKLHDPDSLPTLPAKKRRTELRITGGLWRRWVMAVCWALRFSLDTLVDVVKFLATVMWLKDNETPIKGSSGVEFRPRRFVHRTVSLDDMKLVKNKMGATVNDVALGITQAGLSRYLSRIYAGDAGKKDDSSTERKNNLPKNIRLRSTLLINLRPVPGIQENKQGLAGMMKKNTEAKWGNWVGFVLLPFIIAQRDNPLDYVWETKAIVDRKKQSLEAVFSFSMAEFVLKLFGTKIASALWHRVISHTTLCFSNVVGPMEEISFYGHPIAYLAPGCYGLPQGLMINFQSYVNKMTIALSVDEETVSDPHQLCDDIVESLRLMKNAVMQRV